MALFFGLFTNTLCFRLVIAPNFFIAQALMKRAPSPTCRGGVGGWWVVNLVWEIWRCNLATKFHKPNAGASCLWIMSASVWLKVKWVCQ